MVFKSKVFQAFVRLSQPLAAETKMNPQKFGHLTNHKLEPWKAPLPVFIEDFF